MFCLFLSDKKYCYIVMTLTEGNLDALLKETGEMHDEGLRFISVQLVMALDEIRKLNVMFSSLKTNVVFCRTSAFALEKPKEINYLKYMFEI